MKEKMRENENEYIRNLCYQSHHSNNVSYNHDITFIGANVYNNFSKFGKVLDVVMTGI